MYILIICLKYYYIFSCPSVEGSLSASKILTKRDSNKTKVIGNIDLNYQQRPTVKAGRWCYVTNICLFSKALKLTCCSVHLMQSSWNHIFDTETSLNSDPYKS